MSLIEHERAIVERLAFGRYAETHLHRATRETDLSLLHGREEIVADRAREAARWGVARLLPLAETDSVAAFVIEAQGLRLRRHVWVAREGARIIAETVVSDRLEPYLDVPPTHPPLGELRSGEGQLDAGPRATLRDEPAQEVRAIADALHRIWNGRRFDEVDTLYATDAQWSGPGGRTGGLGALRAWLAERVAETPDASFQLLRLDARGAIVAVLWRYCGHHVASGRRLRLFGSSVLETAEGRIVSDDTVLDEAALAAQLVQPIIAL